MKTAKRYLKRLTSWMNEHVFRGFTTGLEEGDQMYEDASHRMSRTMFEDNNRVRFECPVDDAAREWWTEAFLVPHGLTPEGMGDLITRSVADDKTMTYRFVDGPGQSFAVRVEGVRDLPGDVWYVERTLHLSGSLFNADEMFVPTHMAERGMGRRLMLDLMDASITLGVDRIKVQAQRIGRYAWLRMGFRPDDTSWTAMKGPLINQLMAFQDRLGAVRTNEIIRLVAAGRAETANVLASMRDPVPMRLPTGRVGELPLGRALFVGASPDWNGEIYLKGVDSRAMAAAYVGDVDGR